MIKSGDLWIVGKIIKIFPLEERRNRFYVLEFVVEHGVADTPIKFIATNRMIDRMSSFVEGDVVRVDFSLNGRKWTNKEGEDIYFLDLEAWAINLEKDD